jgi:hypothetical protein
MQLTIELPDTLGYRLKSLPNLNDFMIKVLTQSLSTSETEEIWEEFLANIDQYAVETGISDLAENHDHYLYKRNFK